MTVVAQTVMESSIFLVRVQALTMIIMHSRSLLVVVPQLGGRPRDSVEVRATPVGTGATVEINPEMMQGRVVRLIHLEPALSSGPRVLATRTIVPTLMTQK